MNGFIYNETSDYCIGGLSSGCPQNEQLLNQDSQGAETIIVKGKDIIVDSDFNATRENQQSTSPKNMKALIALKDQNGKGGNIYITKNVKKIYAYIIAEGSVFSGEKATNGAEINYTEKAKNDQNFFGLPPDQLYINGLIISKNVIGATEDSADKTCPVLTNECNTTNFEKWDMNYFRGYNSSLGSRVDQNGNVIPYSSIPPARESLTDIIKNAAIIIDYNPNILYNPPVGIRTFQ